MKNFSIVVIACLAQLIALSGSVFAAAQFAPGEVIVKYKSDIRLPQQELQALYRAVGVRDVYHYTGVMTGFEQLFLTQGTSVQEAIQTLTQSGVVEYAVPNRIYHVYPSVPGLQARIKAKLIENFSLGSPFDFIAGFYDPQPPSQRPALKAAPADVNPPVADPQGPGYDMIKIGASKIWSTHRGSKSIIVADIDTGIDYNHEDLAFNLWRNSQPGSKHDVVGYDFIHDDGLPFDDNFMEGMYIGHGTHTAGTIGAVGGNGKGLSGVNQRVSLMAIKFLAGSGEGSLADSVKAIGYAVDHGAKIINASWGAEGADDSTKVLGDAIQAAQKKGVLFVAAAGNGGTDSVPDDDDTDPSYPASFTYDNMITVAATDEDDEMALFSNYGVKTVHLAAPGTNIMSTKPGDLYQMLDGTSQACPHVAGAAALVWSVHPDWNYKQVKAALLNSVDKIQALNGVVASGGRLNVAKALQQSQSTE